FSAMDIHRVSLHPGWAAFLIIRDLPFMPEREADVVQTLQQAIALEIVDRKRRREALRVLDNSALQIDQQLILLDLVRTSNEFRYFILFQNDGQQTILQTIIRKDIGKRGSDNGAEAVVRQRPRCVLARRATAEVFAGHQNRRSLVSGLVQGKRTLELTIWQIAPIVKQ